MPSSKILLRNKIIRKFVSQNVIISNASVFVFKKIKHEDVNLNRFLVLSTRSIWNFLAPAQIFGQLSRQNRNTEEIRKI